MLMLLRARARRRLLLRQKSTALPQRRPLPRGPSFADFLRQSTVPPARGDAAGHARIIKRRPDGFVPTLPRLFARVAHGEMQFEMSILYAWLKGVWTLTPSHDLLTTKEVERVINVFARAGASKVRLTGGEPTLRRDLVDICSSIKRDNPGVTSLGLTTNGMKLLSRSDGVRLVDALHRRASTRSIFPWIRSMPMFSADDEAARLDASTGAGCDRRVCFLGPERQGQLRGLRGENELN